MAKPTQGQFDTKRGAIFSDCILYRYGLWRTWDINKPKVMFIGLNPSTADERIDDPTIRRCISFAKNWGYGGLVMANLFAFRSTDPKILKIYDSPIGADNDQWLLKLASESQLIVAAWGNGGLMNGRANDVMKLIPNLHYLHLTKLGQPAHPLYLKSNLTPTKWEIEQHD